MTLKFWDDKKIHAKAWPIGKDHGLEVQLDHFPGAALFDMELEKRGADQDHAGLRFSCTIFRWVFSIDYYSVHHAKRENLSRKAEL